LFDLNINLAGGRPFPKLAQLPGLPHPALYAARSEGPAP